MTNKWNTWNSQGLWQLQHSRDRLLQTSMCLCWWLLSRHSYSQPQDARAIYPGTLEYKGRWTFTDTFRNLITCSSRTASVYPSICIHLYLKLRICDKNAHRSSLWHQHIVGSLLAFMTRTQLFFPSPLSYLTSLNNSQSLNVTTLLCWNRGSVPTDFNTSPQSMKDYYYRSASPKPEQKGGHYLRVKWHPFEVVILRIFSRSVETGPPRVGLSVVALCET